MDKFRDKMYRMMQGRYGADELSQVLFFACLVLMLINMFINNHVASLVMLVAILALLGFAYYRIFSKKLYKRQQENQAFLTFRYKLKSRWYNLRQKNKKVFNFSERKNYHIYKCPGCGQKIRIPRGKGKIEVTCPKCKYKFIKKS